MTDPFTLPPGYVAWGEPVESTIGDAPTIADIAEQIRIARVAAERRPPVRIVDHLSGPIGKPTLPAAWDDATREMNEAAAIPARWLEED